MKFKNIPKLAIRWLDWGENIEDDGTRTRDEKAFSKLLKLANDYFKCSSGGNYLTYDEGNYTMFSYEPKHIYKFLRELEKIENQFGDWQCEVYCDAEDNPPNKNEQKSWEKDTMWSVDDLFTDIYEYFN